MNSKHLAEQEGDSAGQHRRARRGDGSRGTALEATQGQMDGFLSQLSYECHLEEVASVGD